jgi:hypothetical protein
MRFVACVAGLPPGMLFCIHLRETCRLGNIFRVAKDAELRYIRQNWLDGPWIISVLRERSVTRPAVDGLMDPMRFQRSNFGVAILAGLMPRKGQGPRTDLHKGRTAKWAVPPKTLWNGHRPENKKEDQPEQEDTSQPDEMGNIFEFSHATAPWKDCRITRGISFARNVPSGLGRYRW